MIVLRYLCFFFFFPSLFFAFGSFVGFSGLIVEVSFLCLSGGGWGVCGTVGVGGFWVGRGHVRL